MSERTTGEILKELMEERNLSQVLLAERSGVRREYINMLINGKRKGRLSMETASALATVLEVEPEVLLGLKPISKYQPKPINSIWREFEKKYNELEFRELPILCHVPCGLPMPVEEQAEGYYMIPKSMLGYAREKPGLFLLIASGNSLEGDGIHPGDKLVIDPTPPDFVDGDIYAVRIRNEEVTCKHVYRLPNNKIKLISTNHEYKEMIYNADEVEIKGLLLLFGSWNKPGQKIQY